MDDMNIQSTESAVASSPATETKVDSGDSSKNVPSVREAIGDAKKRMFGDAKSEVQSKVEPAKAESTGEEPVIEDVQSNESKTQRDEGRDRAREKDKKQISKLTAQKYALKEENARLQAEIEKFKQKMENEPVRENYDDDQAYNRAKIRYDMEMEQGGERLKEKQQQLDEKRHDEWTDRCQSTVKDFNKFSDNYNKHYKWLMTNEPELMNFAGQSVVGPRLIEEAFDDLFTKEDAYATWKGMSRQGRVQLLTNLEHQLIGQLNGRQSRNNVPVQKSNAPTPIAPEKASEKVASKAVSIRDQIAKSKAKMFG